MDYTLIIPFLTAFGLGSIVTAIVQSWLQTRWRISERNFSEKKEAYIGLLEAYHLAAVEPCEKNAKNFAFWQMRCELVGSHEVRKAIEEIVTSIEDFNARIIAHSKLKEVLRKDLNIVD